MKENKTTQQSNTDEVKKPESKVTITTSDVFFDAPEARKRTILAKQKIVEARMLNIYKHINEQISLGNFKAEIMVYDDDITYMKDHGFEVTVVGTGSSGNKKVLIRW